MLTLWFGPNNYVRDENRMSKVLLTLLVLSLCFGGRAYAEEESPVLARVNGDKITRAELDRYRTAILGERVEETGGGALPAGYERVEAEKRKAALTKLVEHRLLLKKARDAYPQERWQGTLDRYAGDEWRAFEQRAGSRLKARRALRQAGVTVEQFKELRRQVFLVEKLLWDEADSGVFVSPREMLGYYRDHQEEFRLPKKIVYRQIVLPLVGDDTENHVRSKAASILAQIRQGADFAQMAGLQSADRDKYPGGLHEVNVPAQQPDWRPPALSGLAEGETSGVQRGSGGWFTITRFVRVEPPRVQPFKEVQGGIRAKLLKEKKMRARQAYLDGLKEKAIIEYLPDRQAVGG